MRIASRRDDVHGDSGDSRQDSDEDKRDGRASHVANEQDEGTGEK